MELRNTLGTALGVSLPATLLFDYPTIDALSDHLLDDVLGNGAASDAMTDEASAPRAVATRAPAHAAAGALVGSIEELSDDDVERLLASRAKRG